MKKEYKDLEMETVLFDDVITASGGCPDDCSPDKVPCKCDGPVECFCNNAFHIICSCDQEKK